MWAGFASAFAGSKATLGISAQDLCGVGMLAAMRWWAGAGAETVRG